MIAGAVSWVTTRHARILHSQCRQVVKKYGQVERTCFLGSGDTNNVQRIIAQCATLSHFNGINFPILMAFPFKNPGARLMRCTLNTEASLPIGELDVRPLRPSTLLLTSRWTSSSSPRWWRWWWWWWWSRIDCWYGMLGGDTARAGERGCKAAGRGGFFLFLLLNFFEIARWWTE